MRRAVAASFAIILAGAAALPARAETRACTGWRAVYTAPLVDTAGRVVAEFVPGETSAPHPFILTGFDKTGRTLWRHEGHAWCYQGSGGCYAGLRYKDKEATEDESTNRLRIVFVDVMPGQSDETRAPDILVVAGINSAFFYGQNTGGLAIDFLGREAEPVFVPEIFRFERCKTPEQSNREKR